MGESITWSEFLRTDGLGDWRAVSEGACACFLAGSYTRAATFVTAICALPSIGERQPEIDIRGGTITVRLITMRSDHYGFTTGDVELAGEISQLAREQGLAADPASIQSVLIIPGARNVADIMPFWQALLDYERRPDSPDEDLVDPRRHGPAFWFERMEQLRSDGRGSIHLAVWVPPELAEARISAALAAGGHMVRDDFAPSWWTLADAAGNEADIATVTARD